MSEGFAVAETLPIPGLDSLPPGTNLLIAGPTLSGKRDIALALLAAGLEQGEFALPVTVDASAGRLLGRNDALADHGDNVYVVDASGTDGAPLAGAHLARKGSPNDLTGIGIGVVEATRAIEQRGGGRIRLALLSLNTLLQYVEPQRLFAFVHTLSGRLSAAGHLGIYTIDPTVAGEQVVSSLSPVFDVRVDIRESDDGSFEVRAMGLPDVGTTWHPLERNP